MDVSMRHGLVRGCAIVEENVDAAASEARAEGGRDATREREEVPNLVAELLEEDRVATRDDERVPHRQRVDIEKGHEAVAREDLARRRARRDDLTEDAGSHPRRLSRLRAIHADEESRAPRRSDTAEHCPCSSCPIV